MKISNKEIIVRLLNQIYDLVDCKIELENKIKQLEIDLENEKSLSDWVSK
jgi:hypothetical protein